jgi:hypothetical protein
MRSAWLLATVTICGCGGGSAAPDEDAQGAWDAQPDALHDARPDGPTLSLDHLCMVGDPDIGPVPVSTKTPACTEASDTATPLLTDVGPLTADAIALHALCARMNPTIETRDDLADPQLAADLHAFFVGLVDRAPLQRALAALPADPDMRARALEAAWLPNNGFEHVLCGELNANGTVSGLHQWSEYYQAEREGRADFLCTKGGATDQTVDMIKYQWKAPGASTFAVKPTGSFFVGASPACTLALGYTVAQLGIPNPVGDTASLHATMYGVTRDWVSALENGALITLYPHAQ